MMNKDFDVKNYVKNLKPATMTVFTNLPFYREAELMCLPSTGDDHSSFTTKDGTQLSAKGMHVAKTAVENMTKIGLFFCLYEEELKQFYKEYNEKKRIITEELDAAKRRTRDETDWRKRPALLREQFRIAEKLQALFADMYKVQFGKSSVTIYEYQLEKLATECGDVL